MNYILGILIILIISLFFISKNLYDKNNILIENEKIIISGYETSIKNIEDKAKFEKEMIIQKEPVVKASERVKVETKKRGEINENNSSNDFVITSF
jgi:hypothetical protein